MQDFVDYQILSPVSENTFLCTGRLCTDASYYNYYSMDSLGPDSIWSDCRMEADKVTTQQLLTPQHKAVKLWLLTLCAS